MDFLQILKNILNPQQVQASGVPNREVPAMSAAEASALLSSVDTSNPTPAMLGDRGDNRTNVLNSSQTGIIGSTGPGSNVVTSPYGSNIGYVNNNTGQYSPYGTNTTPAPAAPTGNPESLFDQQLRAARDLARTNAGDQYNRAVGIRDEGMGLLNQRRGEFQNIFNTGKDDILGGYEKGKGELQQAGQGANSRMMNALAAMGFTGGSSAYVKSQGAQDQANARGLGQLNQDRSLNERANTSQFNENQNWAKTQENSLNRSVEDANNLRGSVESSADVNYLGGLGNMFNTLLSNQAAVNAAAGAKAAQPYAVNLQANTDSLNALLPTLTGGAGQVQSGSVVSDPTLAANMNIDPRKRAGVSGGGLYSGFVR